MIIFLQPQPPSGGNSLPQPSEGKVTGVAKEEEIGAGPTEGVALKDGSN